MAKRQYVYGATEAVAYHEGVRVVVHIDEPWAADDPIVKACPHLFRDDPYDPRGTQPLDDAPVEAATSEPGEKRTTGRRRAASND